MHPRIFARLLRPACLLMFAVCTAALSGCNSKTVVSGTVTYNDAALTSGEVSFVSASGESRSGLIGSDGRYEIIDPPAGDVTVVITSTRIQSDAVAQKGSPITGNLKQVKAGVVVSVIPTQYGDVKTSPLRYTVVSGKQTTDFKLGG
jgi:hypothetical protein